MVRLTPFEMSGQHFRYRGQGAAPYAKSLGKVIESRPQKATLPRGVTEKMASKF
jgi:hypothetical protein